MSDYSCTYLRLFTIGITIDLRGALVAIIIKLQLLSVIIDSLIGNELTADVERASERCSDFRVKFNHEILIISKLIIAILDFN